MSKKVVYIAGPITGIPEYYKPFEQAMDELQAVGLIPLSPTWQPDGLSREQYAQLGLAMMGVADAVLFLPGWEDSRGCSMEMEYCRNTDKPRLEVYNMDSLPRAVRTMATAMEGGKDE